MEQKNALNVINAAVDENNSNKTEARLNIKRSVNDIIPYSNEKYLLMIEYVKRNLK